MPELKNYITSDLATPLILVVDDDYITRVLTRAALEQAGFRVAEAENGKAALLAFQEVDPDIVLLDVLMPEMDGFAACGEIRRLPKGQQLPIVMVTGLEDTDSINRGYEAGATDFITKPINWTILCYRVRYLLRACQDMLQRQKLEEQLYQSQKMEAIGRLAGGVAHDFNNILMVIIGCTDLLLSELQVNAPLYSLIDEVRKAADQAAALVSQLLAFSRKQMLQPAIFDLRQVAKEMEKILRRLIGEDIQLSFILGDEPALVKADPNQIQQVILNLAVNARDAMPQGGVITLEITQVYLDEFYCQNHLEMQPGSYVMLAVSDTGTGMDAQTLTQIFEPFFSTKDRDKGTGLGLATVHGIIKQSQGHISVYSEPGYGTTFKMYLPRILDQEKTEKPALKIAGSPDGCETILVVEDEELVRRVVRRILQHYGYQVLEAGTGAEALRVGEEHSGPIHLLFTDIVMPEMSGKELAAQWLVRRPVTKVVFTSGYTENAIVHHGHVDQEINFIQKPYRPDILAYKVREILDGHTSPPDRILTEDFT